VACAAAAAKVAAAVGELLAASCGPLTDEGLLEVLRSVEVSRRRLESFDSAVIGEIQARNLPGRLVVRSAPRLLSGVLRISPGEAGRRVRQADVLGPRVSLTGQRLAPVLPVTAAARAAGVLCAGSGSSRTGCIGSPGTWTRPPGCWPRPCCTPSRPPHPTATLATEADRGPMQARRRPITPTARAPTPTPTPLATAPAPESRTARRAGRGRRLGGVRARLEDGAG
jgi:hypothetical protein